MAGAQAEWQKELEAALATASMEAGIAREAALAEKDAYWQEEIARRVHEAQSEGSAGLDRRLEAARGEWERAHEAALIERDDAWRDHTEKKLKEAHEQWRADENRRFAAARAEWHQAAQEAFAAHPGAALPPSQEPAPAAGEPSGMPFLNLQEKLPPAEIPPAPSRRGARGGGSVFRKLYRSTIGRLPMRGMVRVAALLLLLVAGFYAYPYLQPFFTQRIAPITSNIAAKVQGIGERMWTPSHTPEVKISPLVGTRKFIRPSSANLRSTPTTNADVVGIVERAAVVEIVTDNGDWLEVRTIGRAAKQGWIHRSLLAEKPFG